MLCLSSEVWRVPWRGLGLWLLAPFGHVVLALGRVVLEKGVEGCLTCTFTASEGWL